MDAGSILIVFLLVGTVAWFILRGREKDLRENAHIARERPKNVARTYTAVSTRGLQQKVNRDMEKLRQLGYRPTSQVPMNSESSYGLQVMFEREDPK